MSSEFVYEHRLRTDQIRLLRIHPGNADRPLKFDIVTRYLSSDVEYIALSYVWESTGALKQVICNGQHVGVTESLHGALLRYRASGSTSLLWADAHCINQNDNVEKSEQVQMMARIYEQANLVIIWLGEEVIGDVAGLRLAQELHDIFADNTLDTTNWSSSEFQAAGASVADPFGWMAFRELLKRPWFRRIWVVQEFISAKAYLMWYGRLEFKPEILLVTVTMLIKRRHTSIISNAFDTEDLTPFISLLGDSGTLWALKKALGPRGSRDCRLVALLWPLRDWKASDPRDKVFALVGLADGLPPGFINYDLSIRQVFVQTAKFVLWDNPSNPLLMLSFITADKMSETPSWVPDWTRNLFNRRPLVSKYLLFTPPQELLAPRSEYMFLADHILSVKGKIFDSVLEVYAYPHIDTKMVIQNYATYYRNIQSWFDLSTRLIEDSPRYRSGQAAEEVLWRTMIFDSTNPHGPGIPGEVYASSFREFRKFVQLGLQADSAAAYHHWDIQKINLMNDSLPFHNSVGNFMAGRQTCATRSGYVGSAPLHAQLDDKICIFQGYPIPFVIRPAEQYGCFEVVGEVYLHGLMNGEAIRSTDATLEMINLV